jgi:hypothetical protein
MPLDPPEQLDAKGNRERDGKPTLPRNRPVNPAPLFEPTRRHFAT